MLGRSLSGFKYFYTLLTSNQPIEVGYVFLILYWANRLDETKRLVYADKNNHYPSARSIYALYQLNSIDDQRFATVRNSRIDLGIQALMDNNLLDQTNLSALIDFYKDYTNDGQFTLADLSEANILNLANFQALMSAPRPAKPADPNRFPDNYLRKILNVLHSPDKFLDQKTYAAALKHPQPQELFEALETLKSNQIYTRNLVDAIISHPTLAIAMHVITSKHLLKTLTPSMYDYIKHFKFITDKQIAGTELDKFIKDRKEIAKNSHMLFSAANSPVANVFKQLPLEIITNIISRTAVYLTKKEITDAVCSNYQRPPSKKI